MQRGQFGKSAPGKVIKAPGDYWAYVPHPLPPMIAPTWELTARTAAAAHALSELGGSASNLPNPHLIINPFLRREAVLSSRIEGTQASVSDLMLFEVGEDGRDKDDIQEVRNYVVALEYGLERLATLPVSLRLFREIHGQLMAGVRGRHATPGEFRRSQNWIGPSGCLLTNATYVPPPVPEMHEALNALEQYLHASSEMPVLIRLALIHYQFEAIHPFLDGNGRIGRLLISLLLCQWDLLPQPLLYLSAYFEENRPEYYRLLLEVSQQGNWEGWLLYFLQGVEVQSRDAQTRANALLALLEEYRTRALTTPHSAHLVPLIELLFESPYVTAEWAARALGKTATAIRTQLERLLEMGILTEITGRERRRVYAATGVLLLLEGA